MLLRDNAPFSKQALESLERILKQHRALIWVDPTSNALSVKRMIRRAEEQLQPQQMSSETSYA